MKEVANAYFNTDVKSAVVAEWIYCHCDLNVLRLLNEPTAAAHKKAMLGGKKKPIELWNKAINHTIIEILATKMIDTIKIYDFKRPFVDGNKRHQMYHHPSQR